MSIRIHTVTDMHWFGLLFFPLLGFLAAFNVPPHHVLSSAQVQGSHGLTSYREMRQALNFEYVLLTRIPVNKGVNYSLS